MKLAQQLQVRRQQVQRTIKQLAEVTGMAAPNLSNTLNERSEPRSSTLEALADALDAKWVLVPRHLLPEVERLLSGKGVGPDEAPSTVDQLFGRGSSE